MVLNNRRYPPRRRTRPVQCLRAYRLQRLHHLHSKTLVRLHSNNGAHRQHLFILYHPFRSLRLQFLLIRTPVVPLCLRQRLILMITSVFQREMVTVMVQLLKRHQSRRQLLPHLLRNRRLRRMLAAKAVTVAHKASLPTATTLFLHQHLPLSQPRVKQPRLRLPILLLPQPKALPCTMGVWQSNLARLVV